MRLSKLFFKTFKEAPHEADIASHQLLERGGYLKKLGKGLYTYTPLMWRVLRKIVTIIREELEKAGAQEIAMPSLHPADLWKESGRWDEYLSEKLLYTTNDREDHDYCLAPTHEEVVTSLVANWVTSYKQLPLILYQFGNKFRDEIRPRFGLMRAKEFYMNDSYSFSTSEEEMEEQYQLMRSAYARVFERMGLDFAVVQAHGGKIGKGKSEEFQVKSRVGEDTILVCGTYAANVEAATAIVPSYAFGETLKPVETVSTPNTQTIEKLATLLQVDPQLILTTIVYKLLYADREEYVAIAIRGDRQLNELKITDHFGAIEVELATEDEVKRLTKASLGFVGPINCPLPFYADETAAVMTNFVCAYCEDDTHYINVNWERDVPKPEFYDFLLAEAGDRCPHTDGTYQLLKGIEVGHIFNLGARYTEKFSVNFQDESGSHHPILMGTYGIGIGRTAAACVEQSHDERGIIWPLSITPFKILITAAAMNNELQVDLAEKIYTQLQELGVEPLLDDRTERLGFKLKDCDLIGIPYKLIVGKSYVNEGKVEIESRGGEKILVAPEAVGEWAREHLCSAQSLNSLSSFV